MAEPSMTEPGTAERDPVRIEAPSGATLRGWHYRADERRWGTRRPIVIFVHGIALTMDCAPVTTLAAALADVGIDLLAYDPEGFGESTTTRRRTSVFRPRRQRRELRAVIEHVRAGRLRGVAPDRIGLHGYSYGGGHAIAVAAEGVPGVRAVAVRSPFVAGAGYVRHVARTEPGRLLLLSLQGIADQLGGLLGLPAWTVPVVRETSEVAVFTGPTGAGLWAMGVRGRRIAPLLRPGDA